MSLLFTGCFFQEAETRITSREINDKNKRISELKKHIQFPSDFKDAEFDLFNTNGFTGETRGIPGSTTVNYKFVIKINPEDSLKWIKGMEKGELTKIDIKWMNLLVNHRMENWKAKSFPMVYERNRVKIIFYKSEGILFKIINLL